MKFNERLKCLREKKGYTQDEIASRLNISRQSVSKWENGINEPDIETIKKLCNILDCSIVELIDDESKIITTKEEKEKKIVNKLFYVNIAIFIFSILLFVVFFRGMSDEIITHWNGQSVDHYCPRIESLFMLLPICFGFGLGVFYNLYSKRSKYYSKFQVQGQLFSVVMQVILTIISVVILSFMDKYSTDIIQLIYVGGTLSFILSMSIFTHPKFNKRNPFFGLKTIFSLSSEEAWNSTNSFFSYIIGGTFSLGYIALLVLYDTEYIYLYLFIPLLLSSICIITYHEILRKRSKK